MCISIYIYIILYMHTYVYMYTYACKHMHMYVCVLFIQIGLASGHCQCAPPLLIGKVIRIEGVAILTQRVHTAHARTLVPNTIPGTAFGTRVLKRAVWGPLGYIVVGL